ncbi:MAG: chemotaxis protein CheW [bacterium]
MSEPSLLHLPHQLVIFRVGETHYGIDIEAVGEILPVLPITSTPGAPVGVLGLADVRKQVVPVFDLHVRFGVPRPQDSSDTRMILVEVGEGSVAMLVDAVEEVLTVKREDFQSVATPGNTSSVGYLNGVVRAEEKLMLWIDHNRLVPSAVTASLVAA